MGKFRATVKTLCSNIETVVLDKPQVIRTALAAVLAGGHVLMEDVPGVAKTMLARALALSSGCAYNRIQCTPDLLEQPFIVFATQNPVEHEGTFPLPEAQLDRFMMRLSIGYPSMMAEASLLEKTRVSHPIDSLAQVTDARTLIKMQASVKEIYVHEKLREYLLRIVNRTRDSVHLTLGASPRASMMLFRAAQAYAAVAGRAYVLPDDIKFLARPVLEHRLALNPESRLRRVTTEAVLNDILKETPVPSGTYARRKGP